MEPPILLFGGACAVAIFVGLYGIYKLNKPVDSDEFYARENKEAAMYEHNEREHIDKTDSMMRGK